MEELFDYSVYIVSFNKTIVLNYQKNEQIFLLCHHTETAQPFGR